mgnify:CR=1 FL=1
MSRLLSCLVAALACCALLPAFAQQTPGAGRPMTNEDVVKLCSLDLGDDLVVEAIRRAPKVEFRLGVDALAALREKKVGRDVIRAMFDRVPPPPPFRRRGCARPSPGRWCARALCRTWRLQCRLP